MAENEVRERSFLQTFPDVLAQGIVLVFLLFPPWFYGLTRFQDKLVAEILIFSLFLGFAPFLGRKGPSASQSVFDATVLLCLGLSFISVIFSDLPYLSLLAFLQLLSCALIYHLIRRAVRTWNGFLIFLWVIVLSGFFYSVYGLLQYAGLLPHSFWYQPDSLASRYVNSGHFGAFLLFPFFIGTSLFVSSRRLSRQVMLSLLLIVMGYALILSRARAVWLAFLAGFVVFLWQVVRNQLLNRRAALGIFLLMIGGGALLFFGGGIQRIIQRFGELWHAMDTPLADQAIQFYSLIFRVNIWKGAVQAIWDRPWGWGLGTFSSVFPRYRVHSDRFLVDYAHNEFLHIAVELGIAGLLLVLGFLILYFRRASSLLKSEAASPSKKVIAAAFMALWVSVILVSQVDFPLRIYAIGILFATFLGLSANLFEPSIEEKRKGGGKKHFWIIPWSLVFMANFVVTRQLFAELHFNEGKRLEEGFSWKEALAEYEKAVRLSPLFPRYHEGLGYLYEQRGKILFDPGQRKTFLKKAIHAYREASRLEPYRAVTHYLLALLYEEEGEFLRAQAEFLKAISMEPTNILFVAEYGHFALRHSLVEEAIEAFEKVKFLPFREDEIKDKTELDAVLRLCYRLTQDPDQLRRVVPDNLGGQTVFARFLAENGRWDLARKEFEALTQRAKAVYPRYKEYFENVGRPTADFYLSHNRFREALDLYQDAAAMLPYHSEIKRKVEEINERLSNP